MFVVFFLINWTFSWILRFFFLVSYLLIFPFVWLVADWQKKFYAYVAGSLRRIFFVVGVRVQFEGRQYLDRQKKQIFLCNRPRRLFPLYLIAYLPWPARFVVVDNILHYPVMGRLGQALGSLSYPKDETDKKKGWIFIGQLFAALKQHQPVVIFYENIAGQSRKRTKRRLDLVNIARSTEAEIVPILLKTEGEGTGSHRDFFLMGKVKIEAKAPLVHQQQADPQIIVNQLKGIFEQGE